MKNIKFTVLIGLIVLSVILALVLGGCDSLIEETYTLTINEPTGEGEVIPEPGEYTHSEDEIVELEADPEAGWEFANWEGEVADENEEITSITVDTDKEVTAVFEEIEDPDEYSLTTTLEGEGEIIVDPDQDVYIQDTVVNIEAVPADGWVFVGWEGDVADNDTVETTVTMDEDQEINAIFEELEEIDPLVHWEFEGEYPEGTEANGEFEFIEGTVGEALQFDGNSTYLEVDENVDVHSENMTISFWMKFNDPVDREGEQVLYWAKPDGGWDQPEGWYINSWDNAALGFIAGDASVELDENRDDVFDESEWVHVTMVHKAAENEDADAYSAIYLDGELKVENNEAGEFPDVHEGPTWMGFNSPELGGGFFNGAIDDFKIYDKALSEEEIQSLSM